MQGPNWSRNCCHTHISLVHMLWLHPFFLDVAKANSIKLAGREEKGSNSQKAGRATELLFPKPGMEIKREHISHTEQPSWKLCLGIEIR